jgi:hypothetical protein
VTHGKRHVTPLRAGFNAVALQIAQITWPPITDTLTATLDANPSTIILTDTMTASMAVA